MKGRMFGFWLFAGLLGFQEVAIACPAGMRQEPEQYFDSARGQMRQTMRCVPVAEGTVGATPRQPVVKWADRWGAIAADGNGNFGIVSDMTSKREASKAAIQECKNRGGGACKVDLAYYNQCAAVGANAKNSFSFRAPTQKEAEEEALGLCEKNTGGKCFVFYSGCSIAARVN